MLQGCNLISACLDLFVSRNGKQAAAVSCCFLWQHKVSEAGAQMEEKVSL